MRLTKEEFDEAFRRYGSMTGFCHFCGKEKPDSERERRESHWQSGEPGQTCGDCLADMRREKGEP